MAEALAAQLRDHGVLDALSGVLGRNGRGKGRKDGEAGNEQWSFHGSDHGSDPGFDPKMTCRGRSFNRPR